jgi:hypothetical protein
VHILQVRTDNKLELITLPTWCQKKKDLHDLPELHFKTGTRVRTFLFMKQPVTLVVDVYSNSQEQNGDQSIMNEYALMITGYDTFGPLTVVCMCDGNYQNISFLPAIMSTSNHMHGEFLSLLFLQAHREAEAHFTADGMSLQSIRIISVQTRGILPRPEEQSRTCGSQSRIIEDQPQCPGM